MNSTQKAIGNILEKNLSSMKENLNVSLTEKAIQKLEEKKMEIAKNYFAQEK